MEAGGGASGSGGDLQMTPKENYRVLKKKFKFLVYENECYQEELRNLQRKLLKLSRDKNFLLDRLMSFEKPGESSDESDSSLQTRTDEPKKPKKKNRGTGQRKRTTTEAKKEEGPPPKLECLDKKPPPNITPHIPPSSQ